MPLVKKHRLQVEEVEYLSKHSESLSKVINFLGEKGIPVELGFSHNSSFLISSECKHGFVYLICSWEVEHIASIMNFSSDIHLVGFPDKFDERLLLDEDSNQKYVFLLSSDGIVEVEVEL